MKKVLLAAFCVAFGLAACKDSGPVVAKVGGTKITEKMLFEKIPPAYQSFANTPLGRKQVVDAIVRETIMIEAAKQAGTDKKKEYTDSVKDFKAEQERQFREYKDGLLIENYLREVHTNISATDADIEAYYQQHKEDFDNPRAYTVRHILLTNKADAQAAFARLQSGEKFDKLAKEVSQDRGSAENGGLIGPVKKGDLVPEFEAVAINLKNNEMSGIVETDYGYHIIFKVSEQKLPAVSFEAAKPEIKRVIEREKFEKWMEDMKAKFGVSVNYEVPDAAAQPAMEEVSEIEFNENGQQ